MLIAPLAGCGGSVVHEGTGGGGGGQSTGSQGTGGQGTGGGDDSCSTANPCKVGACVFPAGSCQAGAKGTCSNMFQCDGPETGPVCGCDGKTIEAEYGDCVVAMASMPYADPSACQTGTFACGPMLQCKRNSDVCLETLPGQPGPTTYECKPFSQVVMPGWCLNGIPDCPCIDQSAFGTGGSGVSCMADADHQETVTVAMP
jgi:hypothetical protein